MLRSRVLALAGCSRLVNPSGAAAPDDGCEAAEKREVAASNHAFAIPTNVPRSCSDLAVSAHPRHSSAHSINCLVISTEPPRFGTLSRTRIGPESSLVGICAIVEVLARLPAAPAFVGFRPVHEIFLFSMRLLTISPTSPSVDR
jgi:hypothetical protein